MDEALVFSTDYDLELRLAARAGCICIPEPLVRVRVHAGSTTRRRVEVNESFIRVYARFAAADGSPEVRRICRRQQAYYARWVARYRMAAREPGPALRAVLFGMRMDPVATVRWLASAAVGRVRRGRGGSVGGVTGGGVVG
jgi:hypothetical protein